MSLIYARSTMRLEIIYYIYFIKDLTLPILISEWAMMPFAAE